MYVPSELERLRVEQNLSERELSRRSGVSPPTVSAVLAGHANLSSTIRVCNALGFSLSWTFADSETGQRRLLLLPGTLQYQLAVFRRKYTAATIHSLRAPRLDVRTIKSIEGENDCRFESIERLGRLLNLEFTLIRGVHNNVMDKREENHAAHP